MPTNKPTRRNLLRLCCGMGIGWKAAATFAQTQQNRTISVLAASDLSAVWPRLMRSFQKTSPNASVRVSFGSSGTFLRQIREGLDYDLFLTADARHAQQLISEGRASPQSRPWIKGGLALCYRLPAVFPTGDQNVTTQWVAQVLGNSKWLAIANPVHAPYGKASQQALESWGLWATAQTRLVVADSAAQAAQFLFQGAAQVALLPISLVATPDRQQARHWRIQHGSLSFAVHRVPAQTHQVITQAMVISKAANRSALDLAAFLRSAEALNELEQVGFERLGSQ